METRGKEWQRWRKGQYNENLFRIRYAKPKMEKNSELFIVYCYKNHSKTVVEAFSVPVDDKKKNVWIRKPIRGYMWIILLALLLCQRDCCEHSSLSCLLVSAPCPWVTHMIKVSHALNIQHSKCWTIPCKISCTITVVISHTCTSTKRNLIRTSRDMILWP